MRIEFGKVICELAEKDKDIILIVGDIGYSIFDEYIDRFPDRFINMGLCEQSMISIAAGMALQGLKPYVYTITPFLIERAFEQIKIDINMNIANVKLIGYDDYPTQGLTHEVTKDGKFMNIFDKIWCSWPQDLEEVREMLEATYKLDSPAFMRLQKA